MRLRGEMSLKIHQKINNLAWKTPLTQLKNNNK